MRVFIKHQIIREDLSDISEGRLRISDKILSRISFSKYDDCLMKILIPGVLFEIYSIIKRNYLKISEIENSFFQSFCEDEIIYIELVSKFSSGEQSYRLDFSKEPNFTDLVINNPPQVSKEVISYITKAA